MRKYVIVIFFVTLSLILLSRIQKTFAIYNADHNTSIASTDRLIIRTKRNESITSVQALSKKLNLRLMRQLDIPRTYSVGIISNNIDQYLALLRSDPAIEFIEPDYKVRALELTNDPGIVNNNQWSMYKIKAADSADSGWNYAKGNSATRIAIVDSGIDQDHLDLSQKIVVQKNCTDSGTSDDIYGHGTHVAGIAAAITNNGTGVAGVGFDSSLINAKALGDDGSGYHSWIAECIRWASDNGASVINLSLGGSQGSQTLKNAIDYAWNSGAVITCSAGNSGKTAAQYPAYYNNCIAIAATDKNDNKASFSTYGASWVDVAAPGVSIYSTMPNHSNDLGPTNYGSMSGTSMSAPHVAGLTGLLSSLANDFTNVQIRSLIQNNADNIYGTGSFWKYGRMNALRSLQSALNTIPNPTTTITPTPTLPMPTATPGLPSSTPTPSTTPVVNPTMTPGVTPTPTSANKPWWCIYVPQYYLCQ